MSHAATTVLPNTVVAARTPVSWRSHRGRCWFLLSAKLASKPHLQPTAVAALIANGQANTRLDQRLANVIEAPAGQTDVMRKILCARDNTWLVVCRKPHRLWWQSDTEDAASAFSILDNLFDLRSRDFANAREKRPLVGPRSKGAIQERPCCPVCALSAGAAERSSFRILRAASCLDWETAGRTSRARCPDVSPLSR
jgi:hypothetical protein